MLEKWRLSIDKKGFAGGLLMDLSNAFDTTNNQFSKTESIYGFNKQALTIICTYNKTIIFLVFLIYNDSI